MILAFMSGDDGRLASFQRAFQEMEQFSIFAISNGPPNSPYRNWEQLHGGGLATETHDSGASGKNLDVHLGFVAMRSLLLL